MSIDLNKLYEKIYDVITFEIFIKFIIWYFFFIWIALLLWVMKDIWNRTNSIFLQILSIFIVLFLTPLWIFLYLIIRPTKTLFEKYYEEIENNLNTFNEIVEEKTNYCENGWHCFNCWEPVKYDFNFCPKCKNDLRNKCHWCDKLINSDWDNCPYCWATQIAFLKEINKKINKILSNVENMNKNNID